MTGTRTVRLTVGPACQARDPDPTVPVEVRAGEPPALLPVEGELVAVDATGATPVDLEGRARAVTHPRQRFTRRPAGPRRLHTPDRQLLALSP